VLVPKLLFIALLLAYWHCCLNHIQNKKETQNLIFGKTLGFSLLHYNTQNRSETHSAHTSNIGSTSVKVGIYIFPASNGALM